MSIETEQVSENVIRKLGERELADYDMEFVQEEHWTDLSELIGRDFGDGPFTFLDVGGGNGQFADRLLNAYPDARGTVLDNAPVLLDRNRAHERKTLIQGSAESLTTLLRGQAFDLICYNWVLHHLVVGGYRNTRSMQRAALRQSRDLLSERGRISVFENIYHGRFFRDLPPWLIFWITTRKSVASFVRRMGARTAGVGVCFGTKRQWDRLISAEKLECSNYQDYTNWPISRFRKVFLHIRSTRIGHFWLKRTEECVSPA